MSEIKGSVTLTFSGRHEPLNGTQFNIYKVSGSKDGNEWIINSEFEKSGIATDVDTGEDMSGYAQILEGYVLEQDNLYDDIEITATSYADSLGRVKFNDLSDGLYLIMGAEWSKGEYAYTPMPLLVEAQTDKGVSVVGEYDTRSNVSDVDISLEVVNLWDDGGNESLRPQSVTVSLFMNGELYDQAILNSENNWRHTWNNLDKSARWQLAEDEVSDDYIIKMDREQDEFIITNIYAPVYGTSDEVEALTVSLTEQGDTTQVWWPVPILTLLGLILFYFGIRSYRKQLRSNEK